MAKDQNNDDQVIIKIAVVGQVGSGKKKIINQLAASHSHASVRTAALSGAEVARTEFIWPDQLPDSSFVRVRVFALTGDPLHQAAEQCLLKEADGIVYVVNCDPNTISSSRECLLAMLENAALVGMDWSQSVVVMQYNQADRYPNFKPSDLDGWLGINGSAVSRHITSTSGDDLEVAVMDAATKVVRKLSSQTAEIS